MLYTNLYPSAHLNFKTVMAAHKNSFIETMGKKVERVKRFSFCFIFSIETDSIKFFVISVHNKV